jgi:cell shape-determining protein MreD
MMRAASHVVAAFLWLVLLGALWRVTPFDIVAPQVALLVALYLGASVRGQVWEATAASLVIGYLHDVIDGGPRFLGAFVLGAVCFLARLATARLLVRGATFIMVFTWIGAVAAVALTWLLRVVVGDAAPSWEHEVPAALGSSA